MNLEELEKKVKKAKAKYNCKLPPGVSTYRTMLPDGTWAYVYDHEKLGNLGRLLLLPRGESGTQFCCEVAGEADDPMTEKRKQILKPITDEFMALLEDIYGSSNEEPKLYEPKKGIPQQVKSEICPCEVCGEATSMMVFAEDANTAGELEDYARLMYSKVKEVNVPTWVVGEVQDVVINGQMAGEALVLKMWPEREEAKIIPSTTLNPMIQKLADDHCKGKPKNKKTKASNKNKPHITSMPAFLDATEGMLDAAKEQVNNMNLAKLKPHVLDDETINHMIRVYDKQKEDIPFCLEQCEYWKKEATNPKQLKQIAQIEKNLNELDRTVTKIQSIIDYCKNLTIDKLLAKEDGELALDVLMGKIPPPC